MSSISIEYDNNKPLTLNDILPGNHVVIKQHGASGAVRQRLMDLGLMPQEVVQVVRAAPLNDPIELNLGGTHVTLRRREAATISVQEPSDV